MELGKTLILGASGAVGNAARVCEALNESPSHISKVGRGLKPISPGLAARAAALAKESPIEAALAAVVEHETDLQKREELRTLFLSALQDANVRVKSRFLFRSY